LRLLSFTLHFFLPTSKIFWDQWSCGPLYYAALFASLPNFSATLNEEKMAYLASPQYDIFSIGICLRDVPLFIESSKVIE
jgi:hypothetical protein